MEALDNFWSVYSNLVLSLGINGLLALSIWLTLACGMLALANAAFMGIGAYTASILTLNYGVPFPVAIAAGMAAPALVAFVIGKPTLRLSGVYLAMATLAFGEVVRIAILNTESLTGGALIGCLFLGFAEVMSVAYIGSTMRDAVAFGLLFIVLLLRPQGMFGKVLERKA